jgi:DNA mismatch repair ATPase MutL
MSEIGFKVDTRLAVLLSENYRSSERALKELVDNAWDADSTSVEITLPEPMSNDPIVIDDNGTGMTRNE